MQHAFCSSSGSSQTRPGSPVQELFSSETDGRYLTHVLDPRLWSPTSQDQQAGGVQYPLRDKVPSESLETNPGKCFKRGGFQAFQLSSLHEERVTQTHQGRQTTLSFNRARRYQGFCNPSLRQRGFLLWKEGPRPCWLPLWGSLFIGKDRGCRNKVAELKRRHAYSPLRSVY